MFRNFNSKIQQIIKDKKFLIAISFVLLIKSFNSLNKSIQIFRKRRLYKKVQQKLNKEIQEKVTSFKEKYTHVVSKELQKQIISYSAKELLQQLSELKITSEQVVITYSLRICEIGFQKNYIADVDFESALQQAREKDNERLQFHNQQQQQLQQQQQNPNKESQASNANNQLKLPPLHGLPIAIKDHFPIKNFYCTNGLISRAQQKQQQDCTFTETLRNLGAIFICMTSLPQFSMDYVCETEIWGRGLNPYSDEFSCGGSSGGSAGVVATRCMPIAIGTDLAGSIRLPAAWCGVYGFKPTNQRVSKRGTLAIPVDSDMNSDRDLSVSVGPIGRNSEDLALFCRAVFGQFFSDPHKNVMPWNEDSYNNFFNDKNDRSQSSQQQTLRIGYVDTCNIIDLVPPVKNVINEVVKELSKRGHYMIQIDFDQFWEIEAIARSLMVGQNLAKSLEDGLQHEKPSNWTQKQFLFANLPFFFKKGLSLMFRSKGWNFMAEQLLFSHNLSYPEVIAKMKDFDKAVYKFYDFWREKNIDFLILPNSQFFTCKHDANMVALAPSYWFLTNQLRMPVGSIPIRLSRLEEQFYESKKQDPISLEIGQQLKNSSNLPISIQVATLPYQDEKCLKAMKIIEDIFKFYNLPQQ